MGEMSAVCAIRSHLPLREAVGALLVPQQPQRRADPERPDGGRVGRRTGQLPALQRPLGADRADVADADGHVQEEGGQQPGAVAGLRAKGGTMAWNTA
jgi:hypothetical protein